MSKENSSRNKLEEPTEAVQAKKMDPAVDESVAAGSGRQEDAVTETGEPELDQPAQIALLRAELEEATDRGLRARAEMENYRKRAVRQIEEERRYANLPLIRDLLPVLDNMGRAIEAAEKTKDAAGLLEGFKMVAQQLQAMLQKHDCKEIEALNEPFDPNRHQAVSQQPSEQFPHNTVLTVVQTGFQLHDRVVRPSQVIVAAATENENKEEKEEA